MSNPLRLAALLLVATFAACGRQEATEPPPGVAAPADQPAPVASSASLLPPEQQLARDILEQLIEIDTTDSHGDNTAAAQAMADRLLAAGFPPEDVQVLGPVERKGNLVARLRGRDSGRKPLLLLAHIDVVAADPADWTLDPFTFIEQDGYFYGRGTSDDKDEAAIHIANLIRMKQEGYQPDRDIIVALTADEEGGEHNGVDWLLKNHPGLIDAAYALNEGGGGALKDGIRVSNNVQASEKVYQSFVLESTNPGGHSSLPMKDNAIYHIADALTRLRDYDFPVTLNEVTRMFFERSADLEEGELAAAMRGVLQDPPEPSAVAYLSGTPYFNSRLRTTCVATRLDAGHAENALPQRARATVNCRVLPGESIDVVEDTLRSVIADEQVTITRVAPAKPSPPSPLTPEILGAIEAVTEEMWPGVPVVPTMSTGATDGLYLRNAGIPVYGVSGLFGDIDDVRAHGQNERILIRSFFEGQEFLYRLTKALSREDVK
ncbi:MAG: M20/M25/M40 family metallo-hydrolase [Gammaproteobacteria bacterium]|nr:M20/M25/M40 family metallo-hydrolase [Gammaproteobacteria bacterium]MDH4253551.1 M20/M25/M40 family metallo-hydrolase [Gammaproteobacteria bacterium]MDH5310109.1 M20/M25/M40 family metallo-hydrolase [Gammaproteobacteria bacterium]